jgi:2-isopropylmalate synthase
MITRISKLVSSITGFAVQYNKAIVGANAFAHESGIHQDGILKNRETYEIMTPASVGLDKTSLVLGKLSGRAAFKDKLSQIGYDLSEEKLNEAFKKFKDLADKKKEILDEDLIALVDDSLTHDGAHYQLVSLDVTCGTKTEANINLAIKIGEEIHKANFVSKDGPVDAIFGAIKKLIQHEAVLDLYQVNGITQGTDAQGSTTIRLKQGNKIFSANASSTDVLVASAMAYINCLQKLNGNS